MIRQNPRNDSSTAEVTKLDDVDGKGCVSTKCGYSGNDLYLARRGTKRRVLCCEHAADFLDLPPSEICGGEAPEEVVA